jgi:hypothetical protein
LHKEVATKGTPCKTRSPTCRPDLSPSQLRSSSPNHRSDSRAFAPHHRVANSPHNGDLSINTTLPLAPRAPPPPPTNPTAPPTTHHLPPPCLHHTSQRPIRRISQAPRRAATKERSNTQSHTRNTPTRQIPPALALCPQTKPQSREQNLRRARQRRRQEAHGDEKVSKHDESRGHVFVLVFP